MSSEDDFEYEYNHYMEEQRKYEIREVATKYEISEDKINKFIGDYEFGGFVDKSDIKNELKREIVQREKVLNDYKSSMKTKNIITGNITQFIKDIVIKYM